MSISMTTSKKDSVRRIKLSNHISIFRIRCSTTPAQNETCLTKAKTVSSHQGLVNHDDTDRGDDVEHHAAASPAALFFGLPPGTAPCLLAPLLHAGAFTDTDFSPRRKFSEHLIKNGITSQEFIRAC
jgi:hypothetical protein